jgi:hypothetical protein
MRLSSDPTPPALTATLGERPVQPWISAPTSTTGRRLAAVAIVPMVAVTVGLALTGEHLQRPVAAGLYWSYLVAASMAIGVYWWRRRPASRFGPLLVVFGILTWIVSWQGSNAPLLFDLGVLAEAPFFVLTFYLFLAFPMGRLEPPAARWLMASLVIGVCAFFLPWALFAPVIAGGGPLTSCAPNCPQNVLQIGSAPNLVEVASKAETYAALAIALGVLGVYAWRLHAASRPQRRALMAVAVTSLLFLPSSTTSRPGSSSSATRRPSTPWRGPSWPPASCCRWASSSRCCRPSAWRPPPSRPCSNGWRSGRPRSSGGMESRTRSTTTSCGLDITTW